jgi:hypothetical protein
LATKDGAFVKPSGVADIGSALTAGTNVLDFTPTLGPFTGIKARGGNIGAIAVLITYLFVQ